MEQNVGGSNPLSHPQRAPVAQRIEHLSSEQRVGGSIPSGRAIHNLGRIAQLAEQLPLKESVGGSIPPALTTMAQFNLEEHLRTEHRRTAFSEYLREIVYGGNDGIVTTFAVVAGFAGAQKDPVSSAFPLVSVLLFGIANLLADGFSMSLGSFLSLRADQDIYKSEKAKEYHEIMREPENEFQETIEILKKNKFSEKDATTLASIYRKNPHYWTEFMMKDELEMTNPEHENPFLVAAFTFVSFTIFGGIPLLPFIIGLEGNTFRISIAFTALALLLLGTLRAFISKQKPLRGIFETLLVGSLSASVAYVVGTFFRI